MKFETEIFAFATILVFFGSGSKEILIVYTFFLKPPWSLKRSKFENANLKSFRDTLACIFVKNHPMEIFLVYKSIESCIFPDFVSIIKHIFNYENYK